MFAKSSLKDIQYYNEENNKVIECLEKAVNNGVREVTIPYFLKNTGIKQRKLYDCIHELIDLDILDIKEYSICPQCLYHNVLKDTYLNRCERCKSVYSPEKTLEKFKFTSRWNK